jgi:hypothetical protein
MIQRKAVEWFGIRNQLHQLQEECGEVVAAVNHLLRGRITHENLMAELVDLDIMLDQMKLWIDNESAWDRAKKQKLIRLQDRIILEQEKDLMKQTERTYETDNR